MRLCAAAGVVAACLAAAAPASAAVDQLVVFRSGQAAQRQSIKAAGTKVHVGSRTCAVPGGTPLAVLLRSHVGRITLHDYGSCSSKSADAAGLYVRKIRNDAAHGANGWVYKVGHATAPAGSADPTGPFGNGSLKPGARVTWFFCHMGANGCQRTLDITKVRPVGDGSVHVTVKAYDDRGRGKPAVGATVYTGGTSAKTDARGVATIVPSGHLFAAKRGAVRSFAI